MHGKRNKFTGGLPEKDGTPSFKAEPYHNSYIKLITRYLYIKKTNPALWRYHLTFIFLPTGTFYTRVQIQGVCF